MTLLTAISRGDEYALCTADSMIFAVLDKEDDAQATSMTAPDKIVALSDLVLVSAAGDVCSIDEFLNSLRPRVTPADDLVACRMAAQEAVNELRRKGLRDIEFVLNGFLDGGGTAIIAGGSSPKGDELLLHEPDAFQAVATTPYGVRTDSLADFHTVAFESAEDLEALGSVVGAFWRSFALHAHLRRTYSDRVTHDVNVTILYRSEPGATPVPFSFSLDSFARRRAKAIARELGEVAHLRAELARLMSTVTPAEQQLAEIRERRAREDAEWQRV